MYLNNTSCYLVGPIEHDTGFGRDWREVAVETLNKLNIKIFNPLDRPKWMKHIDEYVPPKMGREEVLLKVKHSIGKGREERFKIDNLKASSAQTFVRDMCLRYIHSCDFVLCYLPNAKTFGTTEELVIASNAKKPIIMICPDNIPSLWIYDLVKYDYVFDDLQDALGFINNCDQGNIELDPLKWIFLKEYPKFKIMEERYDW